MNVKAVRYMGTLKSCKQIETEESYVDSLATLPIITQKVK